jgi:hypothetical protein
MRSSPGPGSGISEGRSSRGWPLPGSQAAILGLRLDIEVVIVGVVWDVRKDRKTRLHSKRIERNSEYVSMEESKLEGAEEGPPVFITSFS